MQLGLLKGIQTATIIPWNAECITDYHDLTQSKVTSKMKSDISSRLRTDVQHLLLLIYGQSFIEANVLSEKCAAL